jgi:polysaccharide deacetylase 2 family uncharacterized protein YibQ
MAEREAPRSRGGGRAFLALAFALLIGAGGAAAWLHFTDRLEPLLAPAPLVALELPPPGEAPTEGNAQPAAISTEAPAASAGDSAAVASGTAATPAPSETAPSETAASPTSTETAAPAEPGSTGEPSTASLEPPPPPAPAPGSAESATATDTVPEESAAPPAESSPATEAPSAETAAAAAATTGGGEAGTATTSTEMAAATPPPAPAPTLAPPWKRYARPFPAGDTRPRIAIVIAELGLSRAATEAAIERLPPEITLAFNPMAPNLQAWIIKARARGHEVMLDLPMEPLTYPQEDPGPNALLASLGPIENARRLDFILDRADGYVGVASYMGSRFEGAAELIQPVLQTLADRGLLFLANRSGPTSEVPALAESLKLPWLSNDRFLDIEATRIAIDGRLQQLERLARTHKGAVAMGLGYPVTIERVGAWTETLGAKGIALAPASALVGVAAP